ncbi:DNA-directed RNA polymerase II subunit RPB7 [Tanacetum coccineum]
MQLHPRHFGRELREKLVSKLMKDVEGTCSGRHGFVVAITGIEDIGKGIIRDGTGFVTFPVKYLCVVFRPFKGEILEATVTMVNKMGFFAEAGPVQIFVSNHLIPDDMEFQSGDMPNYTTSDGSVKIQKDSEVRLKIIGTRVDATEIVKTINMMMTGTDCEKKANMAVGPWALSGHLETTVESSVFGADSSSAGRSDGGFSDCIGSDFLVGGIHTIVDPDSDLQKTIIKEQLRHLPEILFPKQKLLSSSLSSSFLAAP